MAENCPGMPSLLDYSYMLSGDLGLIELTVDYGGSRVRACEVVEFKGGKVKRRGAYFGEPFEASEWRAEWIERMQ